MAENETLSGHCGQLNASVKEQSAVLPESQIEPERHDVLEVVDERPGRFDDLVQVSYTAVYVEKPGSAGPNGTTGHWNFQVVNGEIHRPERWADAPEAAVKSAQNALEKHRRLRTEESR